MGIWALLCRKGVNTFLMMTGVELAIIIFIELHCLLLSFYTNLERSSIKHYDSSILFLMLSLYLNLHTYNRGRSPLFFAEEAGGERGPFMFDLQFN